MKYHLKCQWPCDSTINLSYYITFKAPIKSTVCDPLLDHEYLFLFWCHRSIWCGIRHFEYNKIRHSVLLQKFLPFCNSFSVLFFRKLYLPLVFWCYLYNKFVIGESDCDWCCGWILIRLQTIKTIFSGWQRYLFNLFMWRLGALVLFLIKILKLF